ncbi:sulfurtransferase [Meiothermus sp. QL-1]|uniref:sulfurtransferase n=1 Tax=Meiothermus sp. QL-1 TaxID=2058095 RepID=UPI000E0BA136|nr:sulfurtransferase [Meiothermus sp. QL-1]RDI95145.1 sulfurtransferase [Meiothermus sp. QL-1]
MDPLVGVDWLSAHLGDPGLRLVDCRFSLQDPTAGRRAYAAGHIPGAIFLDLEQDLCAPPRPDRRGGRHPLPPPELLAARLGQAGLGDEHLVVAYDEPPAGGFYAPHLWWLLRWLGHERVAVLDGGITAWRAAGLPLVAGLEAYPPAVLTPRPQADMVVDAAYVAQRTPGIVLIDARAPERYRGEVEPLDPVAGHIPGAVNRYWLEGLEPSGRFKPASAQAERFAGLEGELVVYCGSGVSATANLLALHLLGRKARLYRGSWSDWVAEPGRPVARGEG